MADSRATKRLKSHVVSDRLTTIFPIIHEMADRLATICPIVQRLADRGTTILAIGYLRGARFSVSDTW